MATTERDLDRSPTPSTSLLPVGGAHRKLNGQCAWSASDDNVAETSFIRRDSGDVTATSPAAIGRSFNHACLPTSSRVSDDIQMTHSNAAATATDRQNLFYVDSKGADDNSGHSVSLGRNSQHGTCSEAGSCSPTSLLAAGSRSAYARVADNCNLPPEVEQLRQDCAISASSSSDAHHTASKFV